MFDLTRQESSLFCGNQRLDGPAAPQLFDHTEHAQSAHDGRDVSRGLKCRVPAAGQRPAALSGMGSTGNGSCLSVKAVISNTGSGVVLLRLRGRTIGGREVLGVSLAK